MTETELPHFVRVTQAARLLGWPLRRVRQMSDAGMLPKRIRPYGRDDYFNLDELTAAVKKLTRVTDVASEARDEDAVELADQATGRPVRRARRRPVRGSSERFA